MSLTGTLERSPNTHPESYFLIEELDPALDEPAPPLFIAFNRARYVQFTLVHLYCLWITALVLPRRTGLVPLIQFQAYLVEVSIALRIRRGRGTNWLLDTIILHVLLRVIGHLRYISESGESFLNWYRSLWPAERLGFFLFTTVIVTPAFSPVFVFGLAVYLALSVQLNTLGIPRWYREL